MKQEKLRKWSKENNVSDAEVMMVLGLKSINQYRNRIMGVTPLKPLEIKALVEYTGLTAEELR